MPYNFNAPLAANSGPVAENIVTATINRWNNKQANPSQINSVFYLNANQQQRFHAQRMKDSFFHNFLQHLNNADPLNKDVKIVIRMAVGSAGNFRPLIGFSTQSNYDIANAYSGKYWQFQYNIVEHPDGSMFIGPDSDDHHEIVPATASAYQSAWDNISINNLYKAVSFLKGDNRKYVDLFIFDNDMVKQFYNHVSQGENGKLQFNFFLGSADENPRDEGGTGSHPMSFRTILDLRYLSGDTASSRGTSGTGSHFWDFSTPCPPNCAGGN